MDVEHQVQSTFSEEGDEAALDAAERDTRTPKGLIISRPSTEEEEEEDLAVSGPLFVPPIDHAEDEGYDGEQEDTLRSGWEWAESPFPENSAAMKAVDGTGRFHSCPASPSGKPRRGPLEADGWTLGPGAFCAMPSATLRTRSATSGGAAMGGRSMRSRSLTPKRRRSRSRTRSLSVSLSLSGSEGPTGAPGGGSASTSCASSPRSTRSTGSSGLASGFRELEDVEWSDTIRKRDSWETKGRRRGHLSENRPHSAHESVRGPGRLLVSIVEGEAVPTTSRPRCRSASGSSAGALLMPDELALNETLESDVHVLEEDSECDYVEQETPHEALLFGTPVVPGASGGSTAGRPSHDDFVWGMRMKRRDSLSRVPKRLMEGLDDEAAELMSSLSLPSSPRLLPRVTDDVEEQSEDPEQETRPNGNDHTGRRSPDEDQDRNSSSGRPGSLSAPPVFPSQASGGTGSQSNDSRGESSAGHLGDSTTWQGARQNADAPATATTVHALGQLVVDGGALRPCSSVGLTGGPLMPSDDMLPDSIQCM